MRKPRVLFLLAFVVCFLLGTWALAMPSYAADGQSSVQGYQLTLSSWPVVLAGLCGVASTHLTELFSHNNAPQWFKAGVNLFLTTLAGILITVQIVPGHTWKAYLAEIGVAVVSSMFIHYFGITAWLQNLVPGGFGGGLAPIAPTPAVSAHTDTGVA